MVASSVVGPVVRSVATTTVNSGQGGLDPDALAYFAAVEAAGGSFDLTSVNAAYTSSYVKQAHNNLFAGLKADGLWTKITELYLLSGKTYAGMAVKAKGTGTLTLTNFVSGDYVSAGSGAGLKGNNSSKYVATGHAFGSLSNCGLFAYLTQRGTGNKRIIGTETGTSFQNCHIADLSGATFEVDIPTDNAVGGSATECRINYSSSSLGDILATATTASSRAVYFRGSSVGTNSVLITEVENTANIDLMRGSTAYSDARLSVCSKTFGLNATDASNLSTRINAFMTSLGANVY